MKVRSRSLPRAERTIREWETDDGWYYELYQRASGGYVIYAAAEDSDDWRVESASTIKACLAAVRQPNADILALASD